MLHQDNMNMILPINYLNSDYRIKMCVISISPNLNTINRIRIYESKDFLKCFYLKDCAPINAYLY